jgi:hypothetical protein
MHTRPGVFRSPIWAAGAIAFAAVMGVYVLLLLTIAVCGHIG